MSKGRCSDCGYRIRGENHKAGRHHQYGDDGHTKVMNLQKPASMKLKSGDKA